MTTSNNPAGIPDPSTVSMRPTAMKYGLFGGLIMIVLGLAFYLTGISDISNQGSAGNTIASILNYVVMIGAIVMAIKVHRDEDLGGFITFGRSVGVGTLTGLILGVIGAIWTFLFFTVVDPGLVEQIREMAWDQAIEGGTTEEQLEQSKGIMDFFTSPVFFSAATLIGGVLIGLVVSLITGAIIKKDPPMA